MNGYLEGLFWILLGLHRFPQAFLWAFLQDSTDILKHCCISYSILLSALMTPLISCRVPQVCLRIPWKRQVIIEIKHHGTAMEQHCCELQGCLLGLHGLVSEWMCWTSAPFEHACQCHASLKKTKTAQAAEHGLGIYIYIFHRFPRLKLKILQYWQIGMTTRCVPPC